MRTLDPTFLFLLASGLLVGGGLAAVLLRSRAILAHRIACSTIRLAALPGLLLAYRGLTGGSLIHFRMAGPVPEHPYWFRLDPLSGLFLALIFAVGGLCAWYGRDYGLHGEPEPSLAFEDLSLAVLIASMAGVVLADDVITFMAAWELMTVSCFLMLPYEQGSRLTQRAGYIFLVASQMGTAFILAAFLGLSYHTGSIDFDAFRHAAPLSPAGKHLLFALVLVGFGTKAGLVPLHIWLPMAHPIAPSHVSALMSGVMIKTAVYGLLRFLFEFLGGPPPAWGLILLAAGAVSALVGGISAVLEQDFKRLLAYSSIENMGILMMGIGAGVYFAGTGSPALAGFCVTAALFHLLNHGLFKSLLFLGAGSVHFATGTRDLEGLGGLMSRMPATGMAVFAGAMAISALPPMNGFASEWLVYQGLWSLSVTADSWARLMGPMAAVTLAAVGGLAMSAAVKLVGVAFLGRPRSMAAREAHESPAGMTRPMAVLAIGCFVLGLAPGLVLPLIGAALPPSLKLPALSAEGPLLFLALPGSTGAGILYPAGIGIGMITVILVVSYFIGQWGSPAGEPRYYAPWGCGYPYQTAIRAFSSPRAAVVSAGRMQYTGGAFSQPFAFTFSRLFARRKSVDRQVRRSDMFPEETRVKVRVSNPFDGWVYKPLRQGMVRLAWRVALIQAGSTQLYLAYMLTTVVLLLLLTR